VKLVKWRDPEAEAVVVVEQVQSAIPVMTPNSDAVQTICEQPRDLMEKVANLLKVVPEKSVPVMIYQNRNRTSTARKRNSVVALIQRLQLQDQALLDVTAFVPKPHLVVAMTMSLQPMVPTRKVVASTLNLVVAQTISVSQLDRNLKAATAKSRNSDVVLITSLRPVVRNWKDADVFTPNTPAAPIATLQLLDPTTKDADATRSNSAAALILSLWPKDPISRAADAKTLLMDAVKMNGLPPMDRNLKAALVNLLNTVAAMTELLPPRVPTTKDAHRNLNFLAVYSNLRSYIIVI
jgi:hypothetical protein